MPHASLGEIRALFERRGTEQYDGEAVTQLEHALQSAWLAEEAGASDAIVTASLLHDVGHLLSRRSGTPTLDGIDDTHEQIGAAWLAGLFASDVTDPIRLHVDAKRYLCCVVDGYRQALSADSQRSLVLQGGVFNKAEAADFIARPGAADAVIVRRLDDRAKQANLRTPTLDHFLQRAERCLRPDSAPR